MIELDNCHKRVCPLMGGRNCIGNRCAVWRQKSVTHGFCGAGGAPVVEVAPVEAVIAAPPAEIAAPVLHSDKKTPFSGRGRYTRRN